MAVWAPAVALRAIGLEQNDVKSKVKKIKCSSSYTLCTLWFDKNIVSTTAPEHAVLSVLPLGVALQTGLSGASEVAETCIFLASI